MKIFNYDDELGLTFTEKQVKTKADVERVISLGKPQKVIDLFVGMYLESLDPSNAIEEDWHKQHLLVESLDPDEERITYYKNTDTGNYLIGHNITLPNTYDVALSARTKLEAENLWLSSYRGFIVAPRPKYVIDVDQWKLDNKSLLDGYHKKQGIEIGGKNISLNKENQHGLADISTMIDKAVSLGVDPFPLNVVLESASGEVGIPILDQTEFDQMFLQFGLARQQYFN